ncbi:MAG: S41 family peptidase [Proteobacteria bacterium]|nr:S41 family peptidase [Pseudomonadota bacterium]
MRRSLVSALPVVVLLLLPSSAGAASSDTYRQLNLFGDVFERVRADFVDEVQDKELIESAIDGMLMSLDPHSSYLNPEKYEEMQVQTKGEFGGLGIEVTMENRLVKVVSPIDDTPAYRAGIKAGDLITHLDGKQVLGLTLSEAVESMRGPVGTDIVLTVRREGVDKPLEVTITRAIIKIRSVRSRAEGDAGYIRITTFNEQTVNGVKKAVEDIRNQIGDSMIGLILDLRNNPGGLLDQAVGVSDLFLDKGEIVSTRGRRHDSTQRFNAKPGDLAEGLPLVLLINGGSASASEIVAGALQDHRRAIVLGTKSFGKGSVQTIIPISGRGAIRLTTARYFTPSGYSIQAKGIEPDIIVKQARIETVDDEKRRSEATLRNPLDGGGSEPDDPAKSNDRSDTAQQDYQLARALDLLRGLALFSGGAVN